MIVYILILQKPLKVKPYTSLTALFEDNGAKILGASKSKLDKHDWNFDYITTRVIISKKETQSTGDVRRNKIPELV